MQPSPWHFVESSVTNAAQAPTNAMTILRPFLLLASVAFVTGFAGYLAVARVTPLTPPPYVEAASPPASWIPASQTVDEDAGQRT